MRFLSSLIINIAILLSCVFKSASAQQQTGIVINFDRGGKANRYVDFNKAKNIKVRTARSVIQLIKISHADVRKTRLERRALNTAYIFFKKYAALFKIDSPIKSTFKLASLNQIYRLPSDLILQQYYQGLPVLGGNFRMNLNADGKVFNVAGHYLDKIKLNITPKISGRQAISIAIMDANKGEPLAQSNRLYKKFLPAKLYVYNEGFIHPSKNIDYKEPSSYRLVWHLISTIDPSLSQEFLIDAHSGEILKRLDSRQEANSNTIQDCSAGCACPILRDNEDDPEVGINPIYGGTDVDDVYIYFDLIRAYYLNEFGRNGANNFGGIGDGITTARNESKGFVYQDGCTSQNCAFGGAWFSYVPRALNFCAGSASFDVFGHEYFHAFNANNIITAPGYTGSILLTQNESGAINESFADTFGEDFASLQDIIQFDWIFGTNSSMQSKRSFAVPEHYSYRISSTNEIRNYPDRYSSENFYCGNENDGGVHWNSTVFSKAVFLASVGTTGWGLEGESFNNCTISGGIGLFKVVQILFHTMIRTNVRIASFNELYDAVNVSCALLIDDPRNIYSVTEDDCVKMRLAMEAVQIDQPGRCNGFIPNLPASCSPEACKLSTSFVDI